MENNAKANDLRQPRILLITKQDFSRPRDGGAMRTHAVYTELLRRGLNVVSLAVESPHKYRGAHPARSFLANVISNLKVLASYVHIGSLSSMRWYRPSMVERIAQQAVQGPFDCVVIEYTQLMGYACLFDEPTVLDMHNIESELLDNYAKSSSSRIHKLIALHEARRLRKLESELPKRVSVLSTVSLHDTEIANEWGHGVRKRKATVVLAANGVSESGFLVDGRRNSDVVFVAHLGWQPNIDAAKWLAREVWPLVVKRAPELRLRLIGRAPADEVKSLAGPGITVHGDVDSVIEYVASARVATAPLLAAGGTRLKILEALSCGTPVVATSLGALGLEGLAGASLAIADAPADFAEMVVRLASEENERGVVRELVESYRWPTTLKEFGDAVESIAFAGVGREQEKTLRVPNTLSTSDDKSFRERVL